MRALLTAMIAAVEACAIALASLVMIAVPALLVWWLVFDLAAEPAAVAQTISGVWFLGHLTPLDFVLDPETTLSFGLPPEALRVSISLAPLGLTLVTVLLAFRAGWRFANRGGLGIAGVIGGVVGFAAAASGIQFFGNPALGSAPWMATFVAGICFAVGGLGGFIWCAALRGHTWWHSCMRWFRHRVGRAGAVLPELSRDVLRYVTGSIAALLGLGALGFAGALVLGYIEIVTLSQSMQLDPLGAALLLLLNFLMLPTACIWSLAWFSGVGFSVGAGTSVTPFETLLGPLPALPILGAIPSDWGWAAILAPLFIILIGVLLGAGLSSSMMKRDVGWTAAILLPVIAAVLVGLLVSGLAALASGSLGPGRLRITGPEPWLLGIAIAVELGLGMILGVTARRVDAGRLRHRFGREPNPLPRRGAADPHADSHPTLATADPHPTLATADPHPTLSTAETIPLPDVRIEQDPVALAAKAKANPEDLEDPEDIARAYAWDEDMPQASDDGDAGSRAMTRNWWFLRRKR